MLLCIASSPPSLEQPIIRHGCSPAQRLAENRNVSNIETDIHADPSKMQWATTRASVSDDAKGVSTASVRGDVAASTVPTKVPFRLAPALLGKDLTARLAAKPAQPWDWRKWGPRSPLLPPRPFLDKTSNYRFEHPRKTAFLAGLDQANEMHWAELEAKWGRWLSLARKDGLETLELETEKIRREMQETADAHNAYLPHSRSTAACPPWSRERERESVVVHSSKLGSMDDAGHAPRFR